MKSTIPDIARKAKVSKATVDRVLNGRPNVNAGTRTRVLEAAAELGYVLDGVLVKAPGIVSHKLDVILPFGQNTYIQNLQEEFLRLGRAKPGISVSIHRIEGFNAERLAAALEGFIGRSTAVALIGIDHPAVREAMGKATQAGIRVMTVASDIPNAARLAFVGIENRAAGRLAGQLLGRLIRQPGPVKVGLIAGSHLYRAHEEREAGCRALFRDDFPSVVALDLVEAHDDLNAARIGVRQMLESHPDLAGLYSIGAGNRGIAAALADCGMQHKVVVVAHELTKHSRASLLDGTFDVIIDQDPAMQASRTIDLMLEPELASEPPLPIWPRVIFRENLP